MSGGECMEKEQVIVCDLDGKLDWISFDDGITLIEAILQENG